MSFHTVPPQRAPADQPPTYAASDLTGSGGLAQIVLNDQTYTLRITRAGKLILTK
ncbi:hemin uptake protein HemP [Sulfitobacter sp.]|jgi:hemin uptake protein HemP|uniref:hemin uptake protein HemP n=1 Tax=Sulfitobacter sp. TaxID=1903071 RepID=UPI003567E476|tara:strand:- start:6223 stop:6387 length:165 start_codon:yes stop_codon:yes gene_type:complete